MNSIAGKTIGINLVALLISIGCEKFLEPEPEPSATNTNSNTLDTANLGREEQHIDSLYYDFTKDIDVQFNFHKDIGFYEGYGVSTLSTPSDEMEHNDTLNFKTFPDYLIGITDGACSDGISTNQATCEAESSIWSSGNIAENTALYRLDETASTVWCDQVLINTVCQDSIDFNNDGYFADGDSTSYIRKKIIHSTDWSDIEFMKWDSADGRYKVGLSDPYILMDTVSYTPTTDIYDSLVYIGIVDTVYHLPYTPISNLLFIDRDEWGIYDTTFYDPDTFHTLASEFNYNKKVISSDSIMFRINGDCDRDGEWDGHEEFWDFGSDWCPDNKENGLGKDKVEKCQAEAYGEPCDCLNAVNPDYVEGTDPNGDNWRDCGWDRLCVDDPGYIGPDYNGSENNGEWDQNEGFDNNSKYDLGEKFIDVGNGVPNELAEIWLDIVPDNDEFDAFIDPFEDRNCNRVLDDIESGDIGNGIWDDDERFTDTNNNGVWDEGEPLYVMDQVASRFVVNYSDNNLLNGIGVKTIDSGEKFIDTTGNHVWDEGEFFQDENLNEIYDGPEICTGIADEDCEEYIFLNLFSHYDESGTPQFETFYRIITTESESETPESRFQDVDSTVTVYSNVKIESLSGEADDYYVTKTKWYEPYGISTNLALGSVDTLRFYDYDYHIFKIGSNDNVVKITHPKYFNHYGYFNSFDELDEGLWEHPEIEEEIYIYTKDRMLRAGENYYSEKFVVTSLAEYRVEEQFEVDFCDGDGIPDLHCYDKNLCFGCNDIEGNGECPASYEVGQACLYASNSGGGGVCLPCDEIVSVPIGQNNSDSLLTDVYKVIRTRTITMIGNGLEMGTRNTIWLSNGLGVVKDKLEIRWSEAFWQEEDSGWKEYTRLELKKIRSHDPGLMRNIFKPVKIVGLDQFGNEADLEYDPYKYNPTFGIHRLNR